MSAGNLYEDLRARFEAIAGNDTYGYRKSRRGVYVNPAKARDWRMFTQGVAAALESPTVAEKERDQLATICHGQWQALENVRLLAARHREEAWAQDMLRFCGQAAVTPSTLRSTCGLTECKGRAMCGKCLAMPQS